MAWKQQISSSSVGSLIESSIYDSAASEHHRFLVKSDQTADERIEQLIEQHTSVVKIAFLQFESTSELDRLLLPNSVATKQYAA